jgi:hypothetical protein
MNRLVTIEMYAQVRFKKLKITIFVGIIPIFFSITKSCQSGGCFLADRLICDCHAD